MADHWTKWKASWKEICDEVLQFTGKPVPEFTDGMITEDAPRHLNDEDLLKLLIGLEINYTKETDCEKSPNGLHEAGPRSACLAETDFVVDYWCKHCGLSGSVRIEPEKIDWG